MHLLRACLFTGIGALATHNIGTQRHISEISSYNPTGYVTNNGSLDSVFYVTKTRYLTVAYVVTVIDASRSSAKEVLLSYSFVEKDGNTEWLGGQTPPASNSYDIVTSYVTFQPSVDTITVTSTESSAKAFRGAAHTGVGKDGWNTTNLATPKSISRKQISASEHATFSGTAYPEKDQATKLRRVLSPRAVGDIVAATIDGVVVSWSNDYHGVTARTVATVDQQSSSSDLEFTTLTTSLFSLTTSKSSPPVLPVYPWDLSIPLGSNTADSGPISVTSSTTTTTVSTSLTSSVSSFTSPSVTLAVYPWDLDFQPLATSTSTTLTTHTLILEAVDSSSAIVAGLSSSGSPSPSITLQIYPWDLDYQPIAASTSTSLAAQVFNSNTVSPSSTINNESKGSATCSSTSPTFTITFDDLPSFDVSSDPGDTDIPPIRNPYRELYWENHYGYGPPPSDPFIPKSPPQLAVYRASNTSDTQGSIGEGGQQPGAIGAGPKSSDSAYWIDAQSMWFGCADGGRNGCSVTVNGYREGITGISMIQHFSVPPCPALQGCALHLVHFVTGMTGLSGLQILASVEGGPVDYYLDNLVLSWSTNSCVAQQVRASSG